MAAACINRFLALFHCGVLALAVLVIFAGAKLLGQENVNLNTEEISKQIDDLSSGRRAVRLNAARSLLASLPLLTSAQTELRSKILSSFAERFSSEEQIGIRIVLLKGVAQPNYSVATRILSLAQSDREPLLREEAQSLRWQLLTQYSTPNALDLFQQHAEHGCKILDEKVNKSSLSELHSNIGQIVIGLKKANQLDCLSRLIAQLKDERQLKTVLQSIEKAQNQTVAISALASITNQLRQDIEVCSDCASILESIKSTLQKNPIAEPTDIQGLQSVSDNINDIFAIRLGRAIPKSLRPIIFAYPQYILFGVLAIAAVVILLAFALLRTRKKLESEKLFHDQQVQEEKFRYQQNLDKLGHSAQLEAARLAIKQFTPPPPTLRRNSIQIAGQFRQASGVCGDFYNWHTSNDGDIWLYLVDVEGRGFLAAISSTLIRHVLDSTMEALSNGTPPEVLATVDRQFERYGTTRDLTATMNLFRISVQNRTLSLANAGMPAPLLFRYGQAQPDPIQAAGVYVGSGYAHYKVEPALATERLSVGDIIVAYSDGLIEARNSNGNIWGTGGIASQVLRYRDSDVETIAEKILDGAALHAGTDNVVADDQCVVVIRIGDNTQQRRLDSAPIIGIVKNSKNDKVGSIEFTIMHSVEAVTALRKTLNPTIREWTNQVQWSGNFEILWLGVYEAILNSFRHATRKGDRIRLTLELKSSAVSVSLDQPTEWRDWDKFLGPERRRLVDSCTALTPEMEHWGTLLMLWYSDSLEVLRQGKEIRMEFLEKSRRGSNE